MLLSPEDHDLLQLHMFMHFGYVMVVIDKQPYRLHRIILQRLYPYTDISLYQCDHINNDRSDNRRVNLRLCTGSQNNINRPKMKKITTSIYKGVSRERRRPRWRACITVNKCRQHIGYYDTELGAAIAYNERAVRYYGDFATINRIKIKV